MIERLLYAVACIMDWMTDALIHPSHPLAPLPRPVWEVADEIVRAEEARLGRR